MQNLNSRLTGAFLFIACLIGAPAALGATVTFSNSFSGPTDVTDQAVTLDQFNPGLGTLISATFTLSAQMNTLAHAVNDGNFFVGWDKLQYDFSLTGDSGYSGIGISASLPATRIVGNGTADGSFSFAELVQVVGSPIWGQTGPTLSANNSFAQAANPVFVGPGSLTFFLSTVNLDALTVAGLQTGGLPNPAPVGLMTNITANIQVVYEYVTPVPEPGTYAMMLAGLGMLGFAARRRKA